MTTRRQYHATAETYLQADRYQPRPARRKKRGGCLPRLTVILLALLASAGAAFLGGPKGETLMVAAGVLVVAGLPIALILEGGEDVE